MCHDDALYKFTYLLTCLLERVLTMGLFVRLRRRASKAQCIDCGKLFSLGSNKPGKQTVHGLKCHLEKCHKDIYTLHMRKVESRQQGPPAKKTRNWARYWRRIVGLTWWLNVWKGQKHWYYQPIRWLSFSFFDRKWMSNPSGQQPRAPTGIGVTPSHVSPAPYIKKFAAARPTKAYNLTKRFQLTAA